MSTDFSRQEYLRRIHRMQDHVESNIDNPFTLEELAGVAGFSKFHFHRIFRGMTGETLLHFVNRIKLERAAAFLAHRHDLTITSIAYQFGFTDPAIFSRAFAANFGMSPSEYRRQFSKIRKALSEARPYNGDLSLFEQSDRQGTVRGDIELLAMADLRVLYVRYTGSYTGLAAAFPGMLAKLFAFASQHNLLEPGKTAVLSIFHDNPEFTDETQLRTSLCASIPCGAMVPEDGEIGSMVISSGEYAVGHFNILQSEFGAAWDFMYGEWLSNSNFQPRDSFPFELYRSDPDDRPGGKQQVDIYLPVEPLKIFY